MQLPKRWASTARRVNAGRRSAFPALRGGLGGGQCPPYEGFSCSKLGEIGDFVHRIAQVAQQREAVSANRFVLCHHHDFVEKFINGGFKGGERFEIAGEVALRE